METERRCMSATMEPDRVAIVGALSTHNRETEMTTQPNNWISTESMAGGRRGEGAGGGFDGVRDPPAPRGPPFHSARALPQPPVHY